MRNWWPSDADQKAGNTTAAAAVVAALWSPEAGDGRVHEIRKVEIETAVAEEERD